MDIPTFVLASASPARRHLLEIAGIEAVICPSDFDESQVQLDDVSELVQVLARSKAERVAESLKEGTAKAQRTQREEEKKEKEEEKEEVGGRNEREYESFLVLGCDSVLAVNGEIYGKPRDATDAIARWQKMRGQVGQLYTGHALIDGAVDNTLVRCQVTQVYFANASDRQISAYVATGEPLNCAGCFAIDGKGGLFVEKIEGCHTNVIGLSLPLLRQMLGELGYDVTDFWESD